MNRERVIVVLKPDGVALGLRSTLIKELSTQSLVLEEEWFIRFDERVVRRLYHSYQDAWFFSAVVDFLSSGSSLVMVWSGLNAVEKIRKVRGSSYNGTGLRGSWSSTKLVGPDGQTIFLKNVIHVSDQGCFQYEYSLLNQRGRLSG